MSFNTKHLLKMHKRGIIENIKEKITELEQARKTTKNRKELKICQQAYS